MPYQNVAADASFGGALRSQKALASARLIAEPFDGQTSEQPYDQYGNAMKRLTPQNYEEDPLYPRVARAMAELLSTGRPVSCPMVFVKMGMLSEENLLAWRQGSVPYLERVIIGSLGKANRVVRTIALHAHDLNLPSLPQDADGPIVHKGHALRFCKTGEPDVEEAYKRVFGTRRAGWKKVGKPIEVKAVSAE